MGNNNSNIKEIIDEHQKLKNKIENNNLKENLIVFDIPVKPNDYCRTYNDQICFESLEELSNTTYNSLYLSSLGINITSYSVEFMPVENLNIWTLSTCVDDKPITMFKHFNWDIEPIPETILNNVNKINELRNQIKKLEEKIRIEENEILNSEYVKSKLNKPIKKTSNYIETIKNIDKRIKETCKYIETVKKFKKNWQNLKN